MPPPPLPRLADGPYFYRYGTADHLEWLEPLILRHELYIPLAADFNDLRDVRPRLKDLTVAEWSAYFKTRIPHTRLSPDLVPLESQLEEIVASLGANKIQELATEQWHDRTTNHRIYCMSRRLDNLSMWEWYAAKQTGYCLEFAKAGFFVDVREVAYEPPPLYDLTDLSNATSSSWFFYKYRDWSNEEEVRLVLPRALGGPIFILDPQILTRVILGENMTEANSDRIRRWGQRRDPSLPVVTAKWDTVRAEFVVR